MTCNFSLCCTSVTICVFTVLLAISSWQFNIQTREYHKCKHEGFRNEITGEYIGNLTVRYIVVYKYYYCTLDNAVDLDIHQKVTVYSDPYGQCRFEYTRCNEGYWGVGVAIASCFLFMSALMLCMVLQEQRRITISYVLPTVVEPYYTTQPSAPPLKIDDEVEGESTI